MKKLELHDLHKKFEARFIDLHGWNIPSVYSSVEKELEAAKNHVALLDRSYLAKIVANGPDALDLLNRISTNDMNELIMGAMCDTVFCTPKGRIVDYVKVLRYDDSLLLISSYLENNHLLEWINRFVILENAEFSDVSSSFLWLTLIGPAARNFLQGLCGKKVVPQDETIWIKQRGIEFPALLNLNFMVPAYNFCLPVKEGRDIFDWFVQQIKKYNGLLMGNQAFQIMRVESGMPDWGTELTEEYNPHEARLNKAVSFTKGCYTGQEVIARLDTYDKVQKYLMVILLEEQIFAEPPFEIYYDSEKIGTLTSYAFDPVTKKSTGLGYIKKNLSVADFKIKIDVVVSGKSVPAKLKIPVTMKNM